MSATEASQGADAGGEEISSFVPVIASVLNHITQRNKEINVTSDRLKIFHSQKIPPIGISDYLQRIVKLITQNKNCHITPYNAHRLLITSILLAAKARDDTYYSNAYYSAIGGISNTEMNKLEITFLVLVDFNLFITPEAYEQYKAYLQQHLVSQGTAELPTGRDSMDVEATPPS